MKKGYLTKAEMRKARTILLKNQPKLDEKGHQWFKVEDNGRLIPVNPPDKNNRIAIGDGKYIIVKEK